MKNSRFTFGFMSRITNDEFAQLVLRVLGVVEEAQPKEPFVVNAFDRLNLHSDALKQVINSSKYHPLTGEINELSKARRSYILAFMKKITANLNSPEEATRKAAATLNKWIHPFRKSFYQTTTDMHTRHILNMSEALLDSPDFIPALTSLGLKTEFELIASRSNTIEQKFRERSNEVAVNYKSSFPFRKAVQRDFNNMLLTLERWGYMMTTSTEEFEAMALKIKEILDYYQRNVKAKATFRRKAKENLPTDATE